MSDTCRYVGGMAVEIYLPSGRELLVEPGQLIELLPSERDALAGRVDFEFDPDPPVEDDAPEVRADVTPDESEEDDL